MRNFFKKLLCLAVVCVITLTAFGCKKGGKGNSSDQATLYVYSFTSGFGKEWLNELIKDYEEKMKDVVIDGKKGINIEPTTDKSTVTGPQMAGRDEVIYFLEQQDYYELISGGYVADISDAVTKTNPYDGKTLESKMFKDQQDYFKRVENGETRYYAYPHYFTGFGIIYDVELFDTKGYYFADGYDVNGKLADMFVGNEDWAKSKGADGVPNTDDDGLPTTYEEFLLLCDYIATIGNDNPLIWSGQYRKAYLTHFINALATDYEGYDQMRLNYTFDGTAENLGKIDAKGNFVLDGGEGTLIDGSNGAELARQAGKYYALDFYSDVYNKPYIKNKTTTLFSSGFDHLEAQDAFLAKDTTRNAMLLDGSWWQMEATSTFNNMSKSNPANSKQNRKLGWMPLPKQSSEKVGEKQTMFDIMYPLCVMKSGLDKNSWQYKYAIDFIQFANSDEQLAQFTQITSCTKALNYSLTTDQYNGLSAYGKTFYNAYKNSDIVFPYANNLLFANNQNTFKEIGDDNGSPFYMSTAYSTYYVLGLEAGVSAETFFSGMYSYFDELTIWKKAK